MRSSAAWMRPCNSSIWFMPVPHPRPAVPLCRSGPCRIEHARPAWASSSLSGINHPPLRFNHLPRQVRARLADIGATTLDLWRIAVIERSKCLLTPKDNPSGPDSPAHRQSRTLEQGRRDPRAGPGRRCRRQLRPYRHADRHGRCRHRAVRKAPEIRCIQPVLAGPRPVHPVGGPRLDADLFAAVPGRRQAGHPGSDQELPPDGRDHRGPPGKLPDRRGRDHHRPAGPGHLQRCRLCHGRGNAARPLRPQGRRSPHLCDRRRRLPDGRHQPGGHRPGRAPPAGQADRVLGQQQHHHRRHRRPVRPHQPGAALQGVGLAGAGNRRPRPGPSTRPSPQPRSRRSPR